MRPENKHRAIFLTQAERKNSGGIILVSALMLISEQRKNKGIKNNESGEFKLGQENTERVL